MDADISLRTASQKCFCCGYITLHDPPAGEICPLCDWEDDALPEHLIEELEVAPIMGFAIRGKSQQPGLRPIYPCGLLPV